MSTCEVDFSDDSDDADPVELYNSKRVIGRKAHQCSECGGDIATGESHTVESYRFEDKFWRDHICDPCQEAAAEFKHHIVGGMFWKSMREQWSEGAHVQACINRLSSARAKAHMQAQWQKWQDRELARRRVNASAAHQNVEKPKP